MITDAILRLLLRVLIVPLGYVCGMLATMAVVVIGYWQIGNLLAGVDEIELFSILDAMMTAMMALTAVVTTMWLIASIGILFAECFAVRSWIFHTANGAISAWLGAQLFTPYDGTQVPFDGDFYIIAAGLAGGLAYWLVAGWSAGFWKPVASPRPDALPAPRAAQTLPPPAENGPRQR
ncbi:MAG: hypothetical protein K0R27_989 [Xanthobacteraceae bacterium]|jgi:hypothetical protein|nr:hypothetical protein [Xanthobacteraceae bacterium]